MNLDEFGLSEGISEVIVTTKSKMHRSSIPNAAPMGVIREEEGCFCRIYKNTRTFENILSTKRFVANVTNDPMLFVVSAFGELSPEEFDLFNDVDIPIIRRANAWVLFGCEIGSDFAKQNLPIGIDASSTDPVIISLDPIDGKILSKEVRAINRGLNAVIEATIHATRYNIQKDEDLRALIDHYRDIVLKCGGKREREAIEFLYGFL
jgi:hypothetical protein